MDKADARTLRVMMRIRRRPKNEALWWVLKLFPPWVSTRQRAFTFFCGILDHGDTLERAALESWWSLYELRDEGWIAEMLRCFRADGVLEAWGGPQSIKNWDAKTARQRQRQYAEICERIAVRRLKTALAGGKHVWLLQAIPEWQSYRPLDLIASGMAGRILQRWKLSEYNLEIELGRHARVPREQRWCKWCLRVNNVYVIGDELRSLST